MAPSSQHLNLIALEDVSVRLNEQTLPQRKKRISRSTLTFMLAVRNNRKTMLSAEHAGAFLRSSTPVRLDAAPDDRRGECGKKTSRCFCRWLYLPVLGQGGRLMLPCPRARLQQNETKLAPWKTAVFSRM